MGKRAQDGRLVDKCLDNVKVGEPFFVLRASDVTAPWAVRNWAANAQTKGTPQEKIDEAMKIATEMETWGQRNGAKVPD